MPLTQCRGHTCFLAASRSQPRFPRQRPAGNKVRCGRLPDRGLGDDACAPHPRRRATPTRSPRSTELASRCLPSWNPSSVHGKGQDSDRMTSYRRCVDAWPARQARHQLPVHSRALHRMFDPIPVVPLVSAPQDRRGAAAAESRAARPRRQPLRVPQVVCCLAQSMERSA